jgi:hypothetical protein
MLEVLFVATDVSFRWLNNVSCLFVSFLLIRSGVLLFSDKVDWLDGSISLKSS